MRKPFSKSIVLLQVCPTNYRSIRLTPESAIGLGSGFIF